MPNEAASAELKALQNNIPQELKALRQWCVWSYEDIGAKKPTKVPYNPNGKLVSVNDPATWSTFDECMQAANKYSGIGFVFSETDPYTFIDLDNTEGDQAALERQIKIMREFQSYSEISPSGQGLHIIVKGKVPAGRRRSFIEIYSSQRYATFTGKVYTNKPITDYQSQLMQLWEQMGSGPATYLFTGNDEAKYSDDEVLRQALAAINGDKFRELFSGEWQGLYPSQSEADFAIIDILSFYTQNRNQIIRLFHQSALGKRDKAKRQDYLNWMINKSFDRMLPPIDFDGFKNAVESKIASTKQQFNSSDKSDDKLQLSLAVSSTIAVSSNGKTSPFDGENLGSNPGAATVSLRPAISVPPGLLGDIARFIYAAAPRPVPEIALAAGIGLMAGICGRAYNISGTGLNQYILVLAKTGRGKEGAASGIDKLMNSIKFQVPTSRNFRGPGIINSGSALVKHINHTSNCFVSVLGEFGMTIEKISNPNATPSDKALYANLLDLYNKSGYGQTFQASIYSKKEDNVDVTDSPALTILGESTPKLFYDVLGEEMISAGLLPRFLIIEYEGIRVDLNENHFNVQPPITLINNFATLVATVEQIMHAKKVINVGMDDEAHRILRNFDKYATNKINEEHNDLVSELWNRGHMKALRLAALVAVGVNMTDPIITPEFAEWAISLVRHDIRLLSSKFEQGVIGSNSHEGKQLAEMARMIKEYVLKDWDYIGRYTQGKNAEILFKQKIITATYLSRRLMAMACFRLDRTGATNSIKRTIQTLIETDKIREIGKQELAVKYGTTQRGFIVSDITLLD